MDSNGRPRLGEIGFGSGTDGRGAGWWVDPTPNDSAEFSTPSNAFEGIAPIGSPAYRQRDLYSTVLHEIGHVLGVNPVQLQAAASRGRISFVNTGIASDLVGMTLHTFVGPSVNALFTNGVHLSALRRENNYTDPATGIVFFGTEDLMNPTRDNGLRRVISNLDALVLRDAYGYSVTPPETFGSFYANLDKTTRTLTIHGGPGSSIFTTGGIGASNDVIRLSRTGNDLTVSIDLGNDHKCRRYIGSWRANNVLVIVA